MKSEIKVTIYEDNDALRETLSFLVKGSEQLRFAGHIPIVAIFLKIANRKCPM